MASRRSSGKRYQKEEEFEEEEVWGSVEGLGGSKLTSSTPRMMIPTPRKEMMNPPSKDYTKRSSAPLTIPRKMVFHHGNGPSSWVNDDDDDGHDDDDDDDDEIVPPHEYIAKRLARTQISSFSVCEGVGRKLKGRDLSEVRNDVLRKTGFLES